MRGSRLVLAAATVSLVWSGLSANGASGTVVPPESTTEPPPSSTAPPTTAAPSTSSTSSTVIPTTTTAPTTTAPPAPLQLPQIETDGLRTARRLRPEGPALVIGDSAISALRWVPGASTALLGWDFVLDLESCRRLITTSCFGREGRRPPNALEALRAAPKGPTTLIIATGYNDGTSGYGTAFRTIVDEARRLGYHRIIWFTLRADVDYVSPGDLGSHLAFQQNNATVRALLATGAYPDVMLADWDSYTNEHPEWFVADGVHYRAIAAWGVADYLSRKMAFVLGRACPQPYEPGGAIAAPCPDPDVAGPIANLEALYPIGADGVLCYEIGTDRRVECRLDTHVVTITRELRVGSVGDDVEALQARLQRLGFFSATPSGTFGSVTQTAVMAFQSASALPVTGVADYATLAALGFDMSSWGQTVTPPPVALRILQFGSTGADVAELQRRLNNAGYSPGPIDGVFGNMTRSAVILYQRSRGFAETGIADAETLAALGFDVTAIT